MAAGKNIPDDELDRLLAQARWPAPREDQLPRLAADWRRIRSARRRRIVLGGLAAAASILVVAAILTWRDAPSPGPRLAEDSDKRPLEIPAPEAPPKATPVENPAVATTANRAIASHAPNLYEQAILARTTARPPAGASLNRQQRARLVNELIDSLADDPQADLAERMVLVRNDLAAYERVLWTAARTQRGARRLGAARLLSQVGTRRSLPVLMELAADPGTHADAMLGLGRLAAEHDLARLASTESDAELRQQLLQMLLERRTTAAVGLYLAFVDDRRSRFDALGVLAGMENPPAELLLDYLASPQQPVRLAAALALSRLPDPDVVERLCASVAGIGRREALIALLLSSSEKAAGCLNEARGNLYLVASVQAAEQQLQSLQAPRGGSP